MKLKQKLHSPDGKCHHWYYICSVCHLPVKSYEAFYDGKQKHLECLKKAQVN